MCDITLQTFLKLWQGDSYVVPLQRAEPIYTYNCCYYYYE